MNYDDANRFLKRRLNVATTLGSNGISAALAANIRNHCFFSAKVAESRILQYLREITDGYADGELGLAEARKRILQYLDREHPGKYDRDDRRITNLASTARLDLVLRQNAAMAAAVGRYQVSRDPDIEERWPCWRYITGPNPRPSHAMHDGKVYRKSDPVWARIYPPWDFNCNCDVEDTDDPAQPSPRSNNLPVPESGFAFDPARAFEDFGVDSIEDPDLRKTVREQMKKHKKEVT